MDLGDINRTDFNSLSEKPELFSLGGIFPVGQGLVYSLGGE